MVERICQFCGGNLNMSGHRSRCPTGRGSETMDAQTHSRNLLTAVQARDPDAAGVAIAGLLEQPVTDRHKELARLMLFLVNANTKWAQMAALDWVLKLPGSAVVVGAVTAAIERLKNNGSLSES